MLCRAGGQSPINGRLNEPNSCIDLSPYPASAKKNGQYSPLTNLCAHPIPNVVTASLHWVGPAPTVITTTLSESDLSNLTLDRIEHELQLLNVNMADANDIAMLAAFKAMPPELDEPSRKALRRLREKMMERARARADL